MKVVYGNMYFAVEAIEEIHSNIKELYQQSLKILSIPYEHNIVKVEKNMESITLLNYPHLNTHAHPYLKDSLKINLTGKNNFKVKIDSKDNPVILHRIELMLSNKNPRIKILQELTRQEDSKGLFSNEHIRYIGRRKYWNALCRKVNFRESIAPEDNLMAKQLDLFGSITSPINRGKTAMSTKKPSAPTKILLTKNLVKSTIFDWGCGKGRDTIFLKQQGFNVISYDKYHKPVPKPSEVDFKKVKTILLNYVLNVIENPNERVALLHDIINYAEKNSLVLISVRSKKEIEEFARKSNWKEYNDGYITSRNTFQKGFTKKEVLNLLTNLFDVVEVSDKVSYIYFIGKIK